MSPRGAWWMACALAWAWQANVAAADESNATLWWSLRPLTSPALPQLDATLARQVRTPPDAFLLAKLAQIKTHKAGFAPEADRRTLLRRLSLDLTGLPPTPQEVRAFVADPAADAYEKQVERLLASPRYGERWARHWLDTIHFADTHGFEHDALRTNAWRYRDYVIGAMNRDTPWPRFIREQLAADVFFPAEPALAAALGFLGAGPYDQSTASTAPRTFDYLDRDDLVTQTLSAFASSTIHCARCHDHKFDPIPKEDYYALQAVFAGVSKGDLPFEESAALVQQRRHWQSLLAAADARNAAVLLAQEYAPVISRWETTLGSNATAWHELAVESAGSSGGATLKVEPDGAITSGGTRPEKDTYTVTGVSKLAKIGALRLEVLAAPSLPKMGPGRQDNGNLHLTEFEAHTLASGAANGTKLKMRRATADFNQEGWSITHALDGNNGTAWGIYPRVGESHVAVFELEAPVPLVEGSRLRVVLHQWHGGGHLIGRFRLSVTQATNATADPVPPQVAAALRRTPENRAPEERLALAAWALRGHALAELARLPGPAKVYAAVPGMAPKPVHVLSRGDIDKPGALAEPGALSAIRALPGRFTLSNPQSEAARRAALADWLAHAQNPLSWRSIVNRVWHFHFGSGLCDTPNDFGRMGGSPSHPELLDWLANDLREGGGALKPLHRRIVLSAAYRQSGEGSAALVAADPENRLLGRMNRPRLDAEQFRDAVLSVSGRLDTAMGGPGIAYFKTSPGQQITPKLDYTAFDWDAPGAARRSIYRVVWRGIPDPFMEALDFPDAALLQPTRPFSASALQALVLFNNDFVLRMSEHFAARVEAQVPDLPGRVAAAVGQALLRDPTAGELQALSAYARQHGLAAMCRVLFNGNEFLFVD